MKLKRPRSRAAQVACALAALGSSGLLAVGVLASPAGAAVNQHSEPSNTGSLSFTTSLATGADAALRLAVPQASTTPGTGVIDWSITDGAEQEWTFKPTVDAADTYQIINDNSNQCLTTDGVAGDQVYQDPCNGSRSQQWKTGLIDALSPWTFVPIQSVSSGLYLDVRGDSFWQGTVIDTWYGNGGNNQGWAIPNNIDLDFPIP